MRFEPLFSADRRSAAVWKLSDLNPEDLLTGGWKDHLLVVPSQARVRTWFSIWKALYNSTMSGLNALELGVFKAGFLSSLISDSAGILPLKSWTGVDPYMGTSQDPYTGSYWEDEEGAQRVYLGAQEVYDRAGQKLLRLKSESFFEQNADFYDLVYVDGDHSLQSAVFDLKASWSSLKPGGLLMFDDYGNTDTPQVTKAANIFMADLGSELDFGVFFGSMFRNSRKHFPIVSFQIGLKKTQA